MSRNSALRLAAALLSVVPAIGCGGSGPAGGGAATPEALIEKFEAAMKSGDGEAIARLVAPPGDAFIRERFRMGGETDAARAELEKALDKTFGPPPTGRTDAFGSPLAEIVLGRASNASDARRPKVKMTLRSRKEQADGTLLLTVDQEFQSNGEPQAHSETITVVETKEGWKLMQITAFLPPGVDRFESEKRAVELLNKRAKEVAAGLFKNRGEAEDLTAIELVSLVASDLQSTTFLDDFPPLRDDASRLRLVARNSADSIPPLPISLRAAPGARPGLVRLTNGVQQREVKTDDVSKTLREVIGPRDDAPVAIRLALAKDLPSEDLLKLFDAVVDLRPVLSQDFALTTEDPATLTSIAPQLTGRRRLAVVGMGRPAAEETLLPDTDPRLDPGSTQLPVALPRSLVDPAAPLRDLIPKAVPTDVLPRKSNGPADVGGPSTGGPSTSGPSTDPNPKKP